MEEGKVKRELNIRRTILLALCIAFAGIAVFSALKLKLMEDDTEKSRVLYEATNETYVRENTPSAGSSSTPPAWYNRASVDLPALQRINPDIVGYLYFEDDEVRRYPILYSGDNEKYLYTTFDGESATAGSIFLEGRNHPDFTDSYNIIYGHNMRNGSMFGSLKNYRLDDSYLAGNKYFQIFTDGCVKRYEIFAYREVKDNAPIYKVFRNGGPEFLTFIVDNIDPGLRGERPRFDNNTEIVTLSTCTVSDDMRFVVSAYLLDTYKYD